MIQELYHKIFGPNGIQVDYSHFMVFTDFDFPKAILIFSGAVLVYLILDYFLDPETIWKKH